MSSIKCAPLLLFCLMCFSSSSQNLSAFTDYRNYFYVFDDGIQYQAEYMPVKGYKVGGAGVGYIDNVDNFKVFYKGKAYHISDIPPASYAATDNIVVYYRDKILYVFDNGTTTRLPGWVLNYVVGDSIVGYFDENSGYYKIYYNGAVKNLPDVIKVNNPVGFVAGDNIIAYTDISNNFKAYYRGRVHDLGTNNVSGYACGANIIGYYDNYNQAYKVFYEGTIATMENLPPKSMQVGDNLIAYVDANGSFKIFYMGNVFTISSFEPDFYSVTDNIVLYGTAGVSFTVFYKGVIYPLERNLPTNYQIDLNSVAYIDTYGYLKLFNNKQTKQVSNIRVTDYTLTKNVLQFKTGLNDLHFILNGKSY